MKYSKLLLFLIVYPFVACTTDSQDDTYEFGSVLVINEGAFLHGNASLTSYNPYTQEVQQGLFTKQNNGRPLGDVAQSATLIEEQLLIVVNNSHKVEVVDAHSLVSSHTISFDVDLSPRYIRAVGNDKAYITSYTDSVAILNLQSMEVVGYIDAGTRTEGIAVAGERAYIANTFHGGDFSPGNTVTIINTANDDIIGTVELREGPSVVKVDSKNRVWVVCNGNWAENNAAVYVLDGTDGSIIQTIELGSEGGDLVFNEAGNTAYISAGGIRSIDMDLLTISDTNLVNGSFYSLGFDNINGPAIYAGVTPQNYEQAGTVNKYDLNGDLIDSFSAGIAPTYFHFTK